ncbi:Phosphoribosylformylglycinamidine synthase subunit PurQ [Streptomyces tanashiensis]
MLRNNHLHFICRDQKLRVENAETAWTSDYTEGQEIEVPLKNMDGRYVADERVLDELEAEAAGRLPLPRRQPQRLAA